MGSLNYRCCCCCRRYLDCTLPGICWSLVFLGGLIIQHIWGEYVTGVIMVLSNMIFYGGILFKNYGRCSSSVAQQTALITTTTSSTTQTTAAIPTTTPETEQTPPDSIISDKQQQQQQQQQQDNDNDNNDNDVPSGVDRMDDVENPRSDLPVVATRLYYLDNIKTFLTALVVTHHVTCAFGGCGAVWPLAVGIYSDNYFQVFAQIVLSLNQGYFMSLFFFIAAYFMPSSYDRKGPAVFLLEKAKRYFLPTLCVTFVQFPLLQFLAQWITKHPLKYNPVPAHTWFLLWLLVFSLVYVHSEKASRTRTNTDTEIQSDNENNDGESYQMEERYFIQGDYANPNSNGRPFPKIWTRWLYGLLYCGVGMWVVFAICFPKESSFGTMPLAIGSVANDIFMFWAGIRAKREGWLEHSLRGQMDIPPWCLRLCVVLEAGGMIFCLVFNRFYLFGVGIAGQYCLDMSLAILEWFQTNMDFQTPWSKFAAEAAYTVYLIHPVVVIACSSVWIKLYTMLGYDIEFEKFYASGTYVAGGSVTLFLSWLVTNLICHLLLWPLSWYFRKLPGLRQIL